MKRTGLAQIPLMIGLLLMAIAVPVATKLVQTNQENRGKAYEAPECKMDSECGANYKCVSQKCVPKATLTPIPSGTNLKNCSDYKTCASNGSCVTYVGVKNVAQSYVCPNSDSRCPNNCPQPTKVPTLSIPTLTPRPTAVKPTAVPTGVANCNSVVGRPIGCACILNLDCLPNNCVSGECAKESCDVAIKRGLGCPCDFNLQCGIDGTSSCIGGHCSTSGTCEWFGNPLENNTTQCFTSTLAGSMLSNVVSCKDGKRTILQTCPGLQTKCDSNTKCSTVSLVDTVDNLVKDVKSLTCFSGVEAFKTTCTSICKSYPNAVMLFNGGCAGVCNMYTIPACADYELVQFVKSGLKAACSVSQPDKAKVCSGVCSPNLMLGVLGAPTAAACTSVCYLNYSAYCLLMPTATPTARVVVTPVAKKCGDGDNKSWKDCGCVCESATANVTKCTDSYYYGRTCEYMMPTLTPTKVPDVTPVIVIGTTCDKTKYNQDGYNASAKVWTHFMDEYTAKCICTGTTTGTAYHYICERGYWACGDGSKVVATCLPPQTCSQCEGKPKAKGKGDADCSNVTTINDASIWRSEFITGELGSVTRNGWQADFDCDGKVTLNDISIWRENFIKSL